MRLGPERATQDRIQILLNPSSDPLYAMEHMFSYTILNLNDEILVRIKELPSFDGNVGLTQNWRQYCKLHRLVALVCFRTMKSLLHFNICSISTSYTPNSDAQIQEVLQTAQSKGLITPALVYACSNWAHHVSFVPSPNPLINFVIPFLQRHTLHWLEIISLTNQDPFEILPQLTRLKVRTYIMISRLISLSQKLIHRFTRSGALL